MSVNTFEKLERAIELLNAQEPVHPNIVRIVNHQRELDYANKFYNWWIDYEAAKDEPNNDLIDGLMDAIESFEKIGKELDKQLRKVNE